MKIKSNQGHREPAKEKMATFMDSTACLRLADN